MYGSGISIRTGSYNINNTANNIGSNCSKYIKRIIIFTIIFIFFNVYLYRNNIVYLFMTRSINPFDYIYNIDCIRFAPGFDSGGHFNRIMELNGVASIAHDRYTKSNGNNDSKNNIIIKYLLLPRDWYDWLKYWYGDNISSNLSNYPLKIISEDDDAEWKKKHCEYWHASQIFRGSKYVKDTSYDVYSSLIPHEQIKLNAMKRISELKELKNKGNIISNTNKIIVTYHKRNLDGNCHNRSCHMLQKDIESILKSEFQINNPESEAVIILLSDHQLPEEEKKFDIVSDDEFNIQVYMALLSDIHIGNPASSVDYIVCIWRNIIDPNRRGCFNPHRSR